MTLKYQFEHIPCERIKHAVDHINAGWFEPHYEVVYEDVDYEYEVEVSGDDLAEFLKFRNGNDDYNLGFKHACEQILNSDFFDLDALEKDEDFIEFMTEKYEEEAKEQCRKKCLNEE